MTFINDTYIRVASRIMADCAEELLLSLECNDDHIDYWRGALKSAYDDYMIVFKSYGNDINIECLNRYDKIIDTVKALNHD